MNEMPEKSFLNAKKGIMSWLFTLDHKRIGILYLVSVMFFFFVGGVLAMLLRLELLSPGQDIRKALKCLPI